MTIRHGIRLTALMALMTILWTAAIGETGITGPGSESCAVNPAGETALTGLAIGTDPLPMLAITTDGGGAPEDEDVRGTLEIIAPVKDALSTVARVPIAIRVRGNTSRRFPKKSFKVRILSGDGAKADLSIAGLRADDDWILNPMYSDTSKIREALGYWLWENMNRCAQAAASSRLRYVEVTVNGDYLGLYGVQERIDRKQVDADRSLGILYKVDGNARPAPEALREAEGEDRCAGLELVFSGKQVHHPWAPAMDYMALLDGKPAAFSSRFSPENAVDFCLWSVLTQARDNHYKNQFIHCVPEASGYVLYRIPWDLNHTFGDLWCHEAPETNYLEYGISALAVDDVAQTLLAAGDRAFREALIARWRGLRQGLITEEALTLAASGLFERLRPAIERDTRRWPECGMGEGNAANIRDIADYLHVTLQRVDGWIDTLEDRRD
ncbi:MAG: CotH kinase family protein [Clostridia bacterium]|nr:CotH kinase family protein [Clostridia bacterium]